MAIGKDKPVIQIRWFDDSRNSKHNEGDKIRQGSTQYGRW
jgi:hypothetical protein